MPRFCANLNFLFTEVPLLDRFEAAAKAGFKAVEIGNPYEASAGEIAAKLKANGLALALINTSAGDAAKGERGRSALAGREKDFDADMEAALGYCAATGCKLIHVMAGLVHQGARRETFVANLKKAARKAAAAGVTGDRADQPPRHPRLFPQQARRGPRHHLRGGRAEPRPAVRPLSPPGGGRRRGRGHQGVRRPHPPLPDRQPARPRRARRRRPELPLAAAADRRQRLPGLGRLRVQARAAAPSRASAGPRPAA